MTCRTTCTGTLAAYGITCLSANLKRTILMISHFEHNNMIRSINIYGLGYRNPITEKDQIIWFFEQQAKHFTKRYITRYWLNQIEQYGEVLFRMEAYELYSFLKSKITEEQERKRALTRAKTQARARLELEHFQKQHAERKAKMDFIGLIHMN